MSAFIVSKRHLDYIITAGLETPHWAGPLRWYVPAERTFQHREDCYERGEPWGEGAPANAAARRRELTRETADQVGAMLWAENRASVNHRYDENDIEDLYEYQLYRRAGGVDVVQALKLIDCYEYQSCEHPEWEDSEARAFCSALRRDLIHRLPGYDRAEWAVSE